MGVVPVLGQDKCVSFFVLNLVNTTDRNRVTLINQHVIKSRARIFAVLTPIIKVCVDLYALLINILHLPKPFPFQSALKWYRNQLKEKTHVKLQYL